MARFTVKGLDVHIEQWNEQATQTVVFLHGFTGSTNTWKKIVSLLPSNIRCIAVDLIGHGKTAAPTTVEFYSMAFQVELLHELFQQLKLDTFTLVGYSMGGRVALSYAVRYPSRIEHLLLESASPGLVEEQQRTTRKQADDTLAEKILANGIESFVNKWENIPLFASQKNFLQKYSRKSVQSAYSREKSGLQTVCAAWEQV